MSARHVLKLDEKWFERVASGEKIAEVRRHDRDFQAGDEVMFAESARGYQTSRWVSGKRDEHGRFVADHTEHRYLPAVITHVLDGRMADGVADDFCVLSITVTGPAEWAEGVR